MENHSFTTEAKTTKPIKGNRTQIYIDLALPKYSKAQQ